MLSFFHYQADIVAVESQAALAPADIEKLEWLFQSSMIEADSRVLKATSFIGPRPGMVSPWSTNAVEIATNMGVKGVSRIERFSPVEGEVPDAFDPMLNHLYPELNQYSLFAGYPEQPIVDVADLEAYNEAEGLALSPEEIAYLKQVATDLGRPLTDSEVFGFAQINSEHCRHKIFGGTFVIDGQEMPCSLFQLIKRTTREHPNKIISAYKDNVAFAQGPVVEQFAPADHARPDYFRVTDIESVISLKAETHNFPTTVEPFNGASTGTGGEIRDRMGGGKGSWPIAGTAVYMTPYARLDDRRAYEQAIPARAWLYQTPQQLLTKASNGASDFGNKFGQPLICGSVLTFEHVEDGVTYGYDKVIMLAGGVGYGTRRDCLKETPQPGQRIVVLGGDNYRIGLGGGSVSSVETGRYGRGIELNAVQRANAEMQKRVYNVVRALCEEDDNPVVSIHDHGSAGHVNCLSELVEDCGGLIDMARLPIGDKTLSYKEIIANESQERMGLLIRQDAVPHVLAVARRERAPMYVVGHTTGDHRFAFEDAQGVRPFDLSVAQMFGSSPKTYMHDRTVHRAYHDPAYDPHTPERYIEAVLSLEAVACKDWLTNKVDRSVTGRVARQQCVGPLQLPLSDCGVVALDYRGRAGIATSLGHAPQAMLADPARGAVLSVCEALTNLVWAPLADGLDGVSLSANWMWPCRAQEGEDARLYEAVKALSDFCVELGINVPTGKDSLSMTQKYDADPHVRKVIAPGTVIVSAGAEVSDVKRVVSPVVDTRRGTTLLFIPFTQAQLQLGGSAFAQSLGAVGSQVPEVDAKYFRAAFQAVQQLVCGGLLLAGHDVSAGGLLTTLLEMCFANTEGGLDIDLPPTADDLSLLLYNESPGVVVQVAGTKLRAAEAVLAEAGLDYAKLGGPTDTVGSNGRMLTLRQGQRTCSFDINQLRDVWYRPSYLLDSYQTQGGLAEARFQAYKSQPVQQKFRGSFVGTFATLGVDPDRRTPTGIRAAIIREKGTNGEREMAYSLYLAGFDVKDVTMTDLISGAETLDDIHMIVFCGGFSNSDVLGSARGWAGAFRFNPKAKATLERYYARTDTLSLGVCNGCQLMMELGLVGLDPSLCHMSPNRSGKFESAFLTVDIPKNPSVMLGDLAGFTLGIWVAHGEGRFSLGQSGRRLNIVAQYSHSAYPGNPNGSDYDVAGLCSDDGRHLCLMPHLERAIFPWQHAYYHPRRHDECTPWLQAFVNARRWVEGRVKSE